VRGGEAKKLQRPRHEDLPLTCGFLERYILDRAENSRASVLNDDIDPARFLQRPLPGFVD